MSTLYRRIAATLLALPVAVASATLAAAAEVAVPGCYGVGIVVCDPTVEYGLPAGVQTYQTEVPVCAGSCTYVPLTLVSTAPGETLHVCVSYRNISGTVTRECAEVPETVDLVYMVQDMVRDAADRLPDIAPIVEAVRGLLEQDAAGLVNQVMGVVCRDWAHCS